MDLTRSLVSTAIAGLVAGTFAACSGAPAEPAATAPDATKTAAEGTQEAAAKTNGCSGANGCGGADGCSAKKDAAHAATGEAAAGDATHAEGTQEATAGENSCNGADGCKGQNGCKGEKKDDKTKEATTTH